MTYRVYRDQLNGRQVEYNPLGWYYVDGEQTLDEDEEAVPVPFERVEEIRVAVASDGSATAR